MSWIDKLHPIPTKGIHSQFGEDLIAQFIFEQIGTRGNFFVDIGAGQYEGEMSNTQLMVDHGWKGLAFDGNPSNPRIIKEFITPEHIQHTLANYDCPKEFDFLSIDIDSSDYWVLAKILELYKPRVICAEFNGCLEPMIPKVLKYESGYTWDGTDKYGFSWEAGRSLLAHHGYSVILNQNDTNLWAVQADEIVGEFFKTPVVKRNQYHPHNPNAEWVKPIL